MSKTVDKARAWDAAARQDERAKIIAWLRDAETQNLIINLTFAMRNREVRKALAMAAFILERNGDSE